MENALCQRMHGRLFFREGLRKFHRSSHTITLHSVLHNLGVVKLKMYSDSDEVTYQMLRDHSWAPTATELPSVVKPTELSSERQWYLYNQIRELCRHGTEDLVCPRPTSGGEDREGEDEEDREGEDEFESEDEQADDTRTSRSSRSQAANVGGVENKATTDAHAINKLCV